MLRFMLKSKIHHAVVTQTELSYAGSITIDSALLEEADILENERVQVVNLNNGVRLETYVIAGERRTGVVCLNGPAARLALPGDVVHILSYAMLDEKELRTHKPRIVILGDDNTVWRE